MALRISRRAILLVCLTVLASLLLVVQGGPPTAHAASAGDVVATRGGGSPWTVTVGVINSSGGYTEISSGAADQPAVSADGSTVAFRSDRATDRGTQIWAANIDGSGLSRLNPAVPSWAASTPQDCVDELPSLSANGDMVAWVHRCQPDPNNSRVWIMNNDGGDKRELTTLDPTDDYSQETFSAFSPDGTKVAYAYYNYPAGYKLRVADVGTSPDASPTDLDLSISGESLSSFSRLTWIGDYVYFGAYSSADYSKPHAYRTDADGSGGTIRLTPLWWNCELPTPSADGEDIICVNNSSNGQQLYRVPAGVSDCIYSGLCTMISDPTGGYVYADGAQVQTGWELDPSSTDSNLAVTDLTISSPDVGDPFLTRGISVTGPSSGVARYEYGWNANTSATEPNTLLQKSTSSTGRVTFRYTEPDESWRLFARAIGTNGNVGPWYGENVTTPDQPIWVGVGDSFSSGHHQDNDEFLCPDPADVTYFGSYICSINDDPHYTTNDPSYSWVDRAVDKFNGYNEVPSAWMMQVDVVAESGTPTSDFGDDDYSPGTADWAASGTQAGALKSHLEARSDSWNAVTVTGGANDPDFGGVLRDWYVDNSSTSAPVPWDISTSAPATDCPDTQTLWDRLQTIESNSWTMKQNIAANLQGIVDVAANASPGVRVVTITYPYVVDGANDCFYNSGSWHGVASVIDELKDAHVDVTGDNVHRIDLTTSFDDTAVADGKIQLTRLYGYPHPSDEGQDDIADLALWEVTGSTFNPW